MYPYIMLGPPPLRKAVTKKLVMYQLQSRPAAVTERGATHGIADSHVPSTIGQLRKSIDAVVSSTSGIHIMVVVNPSSVNSPNRLCEPC